MPRTYKPRGPTVQDEKRCPMCGRTVGRSLRLREGGGPILVERVYAGPGELSQSDHNDLEAKGRAPEWYRQVTVVVRSLADRFGIIADLEARIGQLYGALERATQGIGTKMVKRGKAKKPRRVRYQPDIPVLEPQRAKPPERVHVADVEPVTAQQPKRVMHNVIDVPARIRTTPTRRVQATTTNVTTARRTRKVVWDED